MKVQTAEACLIQGSAMSVSMSGLYAHHFLLRFPTLYGNACSRHYLLHAVIHKLGHCDSCGLWLQRRVVTPVFSWMSLGSTILAMRGARGSVTTSTPATHRLTDLSRQGFVCVTLSSTHAMASVDWQGGPQTLLMYRKVRSLRRMPSPRE